MTESLVGSAFLLASSCRVSHRSVRTPLCRMVTVGVCRLPLDTTSPAMRRRRTWFQTMSSGAVVLGSGGQQAPPTPPAPLAVVQCKEYMYDRLRSLVRSPLALLIAIHRAWLSARQWRVGCGNPNLTIAFDMARQPEHQSRTTHQRKRPDRRPRCAAPFGAHFSFLLSPPVG